MPILTRVSQEELNGFPLSNSLGSGENCQNAMQRVSMAIKIVQVASPFPAYFDRLTYSCHNIASTVVRYLPAGARVLDFGSGACDKTATLAMLGYNCTAVDDLNDGWHLQGGARQAILSFARTMGIDFRLTSTLPDLEPESFDLIMLTDVIEHLKDSPRKLLNNLIGLLKPQGLILITAPNAVNIRKRLAVLIGRTNYQPYSAYFFSDHWRGHVREYTKGDLMILTEAMGLSCCELRGCDHMLSKVPRGLLPAYRVITGCATGWKDSWTLVARKPPMWSPCTPTAA
jgi:2-polyprenyl-3-methyl-5-hydroxy-6-metoxy-1,4-benzoquinol methylase